MLQYILQFIDLADAFGTCMGPLVFFFLVCWYFFYFFLFVFCLGVCVCFSLATSPGGTA